MFGIFDHLDNVLPNTDTSNHDTLRLQYLSACKIMENKHYILKILPHIPASLFDLLLQSCIYKCYLDFINIDESLIEYFNINEREIVFPETLWILIMNWPHAKLVLRTKIPSLHPPVGIFKCRQDPLSFCQFYEMQDCFARFCRILMEFIIQGVMNCSPSNIAPELSCTLRTLDLSGMVDFFDDDSYFMIDQDLPLLKKIIEDINNSTSETFGHKIDIVIDAEIDINEGFECIKKINESSLNPNLGISVHFKKMFITNLNEDDIFPSDFYNVLALARCDYIGFNGYKFVNRSLSKNLFSHIPELVGLVLHSRLEDSIILDLSLLDLSSFENIELLSLHGYGNNCPVNFVFNMCKGLKYLDLNDCDLQNNDLECLGSSIHSDTLLVLDLSSNDFSNNLSADELIKLCYKLNNVKVLILDNCALHTLSSHSLLNLVSALTDCVRLEFLSINCNPFSLTLTNIIIDGLAQNKSLRYLSLDLPGNQYFLCKTFHETINRYRNSPIYISWCFFE